ncbi:MAG: DUF2442 domain-containing protein [Gemmatimonadaceae bacterium]
MVRIRTVEALDGLRVRLGFTDGTVGEVDLTEYMWGPIFEPVVRERRFFEAVSVDPDAGTIVWPNGADMDPDVLYELAHRAGARRT